MILFSDRGTPDGYHQEHGYSGHTFKWLKDDGSFVYVQVHLRAEGGFKVRDCSASGSEGPSKLVYLQTLDDATATRLAGEKPDYATQALFETIEAGKYPTWNVFIVGRVAIFTQNMLLISCLANHDSGAS